MSINFPQSLDDWLSYLESLNPDHIDLGLERVETVFQRLNIHSIAKKVITIAGTNGKGTCVAYLDELLRLSGYSVGCYTSPHLIHFNERIVVNANQVEDEPLCDAFKLVYEAREKEKLTYFEFTTLAAFIIFAQNDLDFVLLEVGLGGRLDAVNIISADIAVISSVDLDHQEWLGHDRESIGYEKAGIFRADKPAVIGDRDIPKTVSEYANKLGVKLYCIGEDFDIKAKNEKLKTWSWQGQNEFGDTLEIADLVQPKLSLELAATVLQVLVCLNIQLQKTIFLEALENVTLPGRFQQLTLDSGAQLIVDVAHNPAAVAHMVEKLQAQSYIGKLHVIFGVLADKDWQTMINLMQPHVDYWYLSSLTSNRCVDLAKLAGYLTDLGVENVVTYPDVASAFNGVYKNISQYDCILVCGSFYLAAPILQIIQGACHEK